MRKETFKKLLNIAIAFGISGMIFTYIGGISLMLFPDMPVNWGIFLASFIVFGLYIYLPLSLLLIGVAYIIYLWGLLVKRYKYGK